MFWPMAIVCDLNNTKKFTLYTSGELSTIELAAKVIEKWKEDNEIDVLFEFIVDENNNIVNHHNNKEVLENIHNKSKENTFWPMAIARDLNNTKKFTLYTSGELSTIEEATKMIEKWKEDNEIDILFDFITDEKNDIINYDNIVGSLGNSHNKRKNIYLNFSNEDYKRKALNTKKVNYENEITSSDAFMILLKDVEYETINNLCIEVATKIKKIIPEINPQTIYKIINSQVENAEFKKIVLEQAYKMIYEGKKLGTKTDGKRNASNWIIHCLIEGELMSTLASSAKLDSDTAMKLGILHDIGRKKDHSFMHTVKGFEYLIDQGLINESFCALTHSFSPTPKNGINIGNRCATGDPPIDGFYVNENGEGVFENDALLDDVTFFLENYEYNYYDIILNIADLMSTSEGIKTPFERIQNIYSKREPDPRNSLFFKVCVINSLISFISNIKEEEYTPINSKDINSIEEIDNILLKESDSFMDSYLNIIKKNKTKRK